MVIKKKEMHGGYNPITELDGAYRELMLDFGILKLGKGEEYSCSLGRERAFMLVEGKLTYAWEDRVYTAERSSPFDQAPICLQVAAGVAVKLVALEDSEVCVERCENEKRFPSVLYKPEDIRTDIFGEGTLGDTSRRSVRTVFDGQSAPYSNMVLGEVINHPGKWSSYPPHDHPQPEVYYYRMFPRQGFGVSLLEDEATIVHDGDTSLIYPGHTHSQVAAPGYAMYYIWMIPHLKDDRWLPTTRYYRKEHQWLLEKDVKVWPERKYEKQ
ncbi:MAG: 5-deoxy-glucuronate isomerase [Spirochaetia bacterium]|jgi:5-deoxy-glucuronate isomerase|nr:5-deoxy-glucuronate isomerase [Spirochaetia bacterium]